MNEKYEVKQFKEEGYQRLINHESWTVAMLNYIDELEPLNIKNVQAHTLTDEVFVLLEGRCILYVCEIENGRITNIEPIDMESNKVYTIKKGIYHTHTLSKDGKVLIIENENTSDDNSPVIDLSDYERQQLYDIMNKLWS